MQSDAAVRTIEDDKLGRATFAEILAKALQLPKDSDGLVVALEGEWGSGKTVILNFVEEYVKKNNEHAIIVRFDPWLISGFETLCEGFFVQLATAINNVSKNDVAKRASKNVLRLAQFIGPIKLLPGVEPWGTVVEKVLQSVGTAVQSATDFADLDLNKRKQKVEESLGELNQPIIVMIDDIDRLRPTEVRTIFQLVKAVGNFKRVSYLLAYDPTPTYAALATEGISNGKEYLEKIVQVPYTIPKLRYVQKKRYLSSLLFSFIKRYDLDLGGTERERIHEALSSGGLTHAMRHPRDVNRLLNKLRISAIATAGEVHLADVVVFEALAIRFPHAAAAIRKGPFDFIKGAGEEDFLMGNYAYTPGEMSGNPATQWPVWKKALFEPVEDAEKDVLLSMIEFLFPDFTELHSSHMPKNPEADLRVCAPGPLMKLLSVGQAEGIPSAIEVRSFLGDKENREDIIDSIIEDDMVAAWFDSLTCHVELDYPDDLAQLCELSFDAVVKEYRLRNNNVVTHAEKFLNKMIGLLPEESEKHALFLGVVSNPKCLTLAHNIILAAVREHGKWVQKPGEDIPEERRLIKTWDIVDQGKKAWLNAVKMKSLNHEEFLKEPEVLSILHRWGQLNGNDYGEVQKFVDALTSSDDGMRNFFKLWHGSGFNGAELLIGNKKEFLEHFNRLPGRTSYNDELVKYITSIGES